MAYKQVCERLDYWLNFWVGNDEEYTVQSRQWYLRIKMVI